VTHYADSPWCGWRAAALHLVLRCSKELDRPRNFRRPEVSERMQIATDGHYKVG